MIDLILNAPERLRLEHLVAHSHDARLVQRAYALLWLDDGDLVSEVAERLAVSRQFVYNWVTLWAERADQEITLRLADAPRPGRPCRAQGIIDPLIDAVVDEDPREFGYRSTIWTAALLVHYLRQEHQLSVSDDSVRLAIARLRIRWKRPRHHLALRAPHWRQSKGGSNVGFSAKGTRSS
jgi:transposase